jgi:hypothetical protein
MLEFSNLIKDKKQMWLKLHKNQYMSACWMNIYETNLSQILKTENEGNPPIAGKIMTHPQAMEPRLIPWQLLSLLATSH